MSELPNLGCSDTTPPSAASLCAASKCSIILELPHETYFHHSGTLLEQRPLPKFRTAFLSKSKLSELSVKPISK